MPSVRTSVLWLLLLVVAIARGSIALGCSVIGARISNLELVRLADAVLVGRSIRGQSGAVEFEVVRGMKGRTAISTRIWVKEGTLETHREQTVEESHSPTGFIGPCLFEGFEL